VLNFKLHPFCVSPDDPGQLAAGEEQGLPWQFKHLCPQAEGSKVLPALHAPAWGSSKGLAMVLALSLEGLVLALALRGLCTASLSQTWGLFPHPASCLAAEVPSWDYHHWTWMGGPSDRVQGARVVPVLGGMWVFKLLWYVTLSMGRTRAVASLRAPWEGVSATE
jgi:hypothetical protein